MYMHMSNPLYQIVPNKLPPTTNRHRRESLLAPLGNQALAEVGCGTPTSQPGLHVLASVVKHGFGDGLRHRVLYHRFIRHFVLVPESHELGARFGSICLGSFRFVSRWHNPGRC